MHFGCNLFELLIEAWNMKKLLDQYSILIFMMLDFYFNFHNARFLFLFLYLKPDITVDINGLKKLVWTMIDKHVEDMMRFVDI